MADKLGIEHFKVLIDVGLEVPKKIAEITADGKVDLFEIIGLVPTATALVAVAKGWKDIVAEFKDLDDAERTQIHDYFAEKFTIPDKDVEAFVEDALSWALTTISLVQRFKDLKNPAAPPTI
jgi:ActR/RegA family two-component response regulator